MTFDVFIQILGLIGSALIILAFCLKSDNRFKIFMMMGILTFSLHFFLLGAMAGAAVNFLNFLRIGFSIKFHKSNIAMFIFLASYLVAGVLIYESPKDLIPIISGCIGTFAVYKLSGIKLRLCMFITSGLWLAYSIIFKSIGGIITELFVQTSNLVTIFRLVKDKKKAEA